MAGTLQHTTRVTGLVDRMVSGLSDAGYSCVTLYEPPTW